MDFQQLRYIVTIADCRSVTKAAAQLYISQPALSHFLRKTEEELGLPLFDRTTNPIALTIAGELYVKTAREILHMSDTFNRQLGDIADNRTGRLRLGLPRDRASYMLPVLLPAFAKLYPGFEVKHMTAGADELKEQLRKGWLDFILLPSYGPEPGLSTQLIYEEELLLVAQKGTIGSHHLLPGRTDAVDPSTLSNLPFLLPPVGRAIRASTDLLMRAYRIKPQTVEEYDSNTTLVRMAAVGWGVAIVPNFTVGMSTPEPELEIFRLGSPPITWEIYAIYRKDAYVSRVEQDFFRLAAQLFGGKGAQ